MSFLKAKARIIGVVASVVCGATLLGSSLIYASVATNNYKTWKQTGSSWSSMTLGAHGGTVASAGCAVTSAAMLMVKSGAVTDADFNPGVLIEYLNQHGGFSADGDLNWSALAGYAPDFRFDSRVNVYGTDAEKTARIQQLLDAGYSVIAQVKYGAHFVAVDAVKGSEIYMMDPGSSGTSLSATYGIASITSLRVFRTSGNSVAAEVQGPVRPAETETEEIAEAAPVAPACVPEQAAAQTAPETAPTVMETISVVTMTAETAPVMTAPENQADMTAPVVTATSGSVQSTMPETTTTVATTQPEVVIYTKATATTAVNINTETIRPEIVLPAMDTHEEILIDPITDEPEEIVEPAPSLDCVQIVILETAPAVAPDVVTGDTAVTEETIQEPAEIYIPEDQAETALIEIQEKNLYMTVRFYILKNLNLYTGPDTSAGIISVVPVGTCLDVVEVDNAFQWGKVRYDGQEGWISLRSVSMTSEK